MFFPHKQVHVKEKKDTSMVVEDERHATPVRLFRFELKSKKVKRLTENTDRISAMAVSRDGAFRAYVTSGQDSTGMVTVEATNPIRHQSLCVTYRAPK